MTSTDLPRTMTLILRLSVAGAGRISGTVERVRTGERERFEGLERLSPIVARMVQERARTGES